MRPALLGLGLAMLGAPLAAQTAPARPAVSVRALLERARVQSERKDSAGALESLRQARGLAPNSEDVLQASAEASLAAHATLPAVRAIEALTRMLPTVARYQYLEGLALLQSGDAAAAVDALKEADRLEPGQPATLIALGRALAGRRLYDDARSCLQRALSLAPDDGNALAALAEAEEGLGELAEAELHAQRALARGGAPSVANLALGMVRLKQERYAAAREALLKAVAADPDSARAHYQLSLAFARLKDPVSAQRHLQLYGQKAKETERRVSAVRAVTGFSTGGMQP